MTDPLAHLYAETGGGDVDGELELPVDETSLEKLNAERGADVEELSDHDLDELAVLIGSKLEDGGLSDEEAAELGLGDLADLDDGEVELVLNSTGHAVLRRLLDQRHPDLRFEGRPS